MIWRISATCVCDQRWFRIHSTGGSSTNAVSIRFQHKRTPDPWLVQHNWSHWHVPHGSGIRAPSCRGVHDVANGLIPSTHRRKTREPPYPAP
ncbi:hypothetical protein PsYK624_070310 [Phanerochaete sordida]|uniref:Uncharacterized protein n=1 Tax=Phanerochaete sordida TaxID=48140 RepID=A0A9P3G9W0_9APHY|nr:hypothetical protein PsYK624_070310 [Phanerochaete sordida]